MSWRYQGSCNTRHGTGYSGLPSGANFGDGVWTPACRNRRWQIRFTRAFVCAVERGRAVPSIPALAVRLANLGIGFDEFFKGVQSDMTMQYTACHGHHQEAPARRRR